MESHIRTLFEQYPYHPFTLDDIKESLLENKENIQNISVYIRNNSLEEKLSNLMNKFISESGFALIENEYVYYPEVKINERLDEQKEIIGEQSKRISELEKQIEENNKMIEELTKKIEQLSVKKRFILF